MIIRIIKISGLIFVWMSLLILVSMGCDKQAELWDPEALIVAKPDSGKTTQVFELSIQVMNPDQNQDLFVRWDFTGDSVWDTPFSGQLTSPHRFYQKGEYHVMAEILTEGGERFILKRTIRVEQGYSAPHASLAIIPSTGHFMTDFLFDASASFDDEDSASALTYQMDYENDGKWDTEAQSDPVFRHRFDKPGSKPVRLGVWDPTQRLASVYDTLEVHVTDTLIRPAFSWMPEEATVKDTFLFDASSTSHEPGVDRLFTYAWMIHDEKDYGPYDNPYFSHCFWSSGTKKVTLTVTDEAGLSNSLTRELYIGKENKPPKPVIRISTPYGNITTQFYLDVWSSSDDATPPSLMVYRWDFNSDGLWETGWINEKTLFHQFPEAGEYWITVQAEDESGERGTVKIRVLVSPYPVETGFIKDRRDDKYYGTVKIGEQWWMSDNLDYRIPPKIKLPMIQMGYDERVANCDLYGSLYQGDRTVWYTESGKEICPDGWRLPTEADWMELSRHLPATGSRESMMVNGSMGFNGRLTGYGWFRFMYDPMDPDAIIDTVYYFDRMGKEVRYFSSTVRPYVYSTQAQFYMGLTWNWDLPDFLWGDRDGYYYVRCLKKPD